MKKKNPMSLVASHLAPPPPHLGEAGRDLFAKLVLEYEIDDSAGLALVEVAAAAADRIEAAQSAIARDGEFQTSASGVLHPHPALGLEKTASERMLAAFRGLHLDVAPKLPRGRPAGVTSISWRDG